MRRVVQAIAAADEVLHGANVVVIATSSLTTRERQSAVW
jgi:hypothetical protein